MPLFAFWDYDMAAWERLLQVVTVVINLTPLNVIEGAAQIRLKKSRCFVIMEPWQRQESARMSAIHEKGGRCFTEGGR